MARDAFPSGEVEELRHELRTWHAECDAVGVPRDPKILVRHHRANGTLIGSADRYGDVLAKIRAIQDDYEAQSREWLVCDRIRVALRAPITPIREGAESS